MLDRTEYAISIKRLKTGCTDEQYKIDYTVLMSCWRINFPEVKVKWMCMEKDSHAILHLHGVIDCPKYFRYLRLKEAGFNIHISKILDKEGWLRYATDNYTNQAFMKCLEPVPDYEPKLPHKLFPARVGPTDQA